MIIPSTPLDPIIVGITGHSDIAPGCRTLCASPYKPSWPTYRRGSVTRRTR
jgi:hypothetical protein